MAFKLAQKPSYTVPVKVHTPNDKGSFDTSEFKVQFLCRPEIATEYKMEVLIYGVQEIKQLHPSQSAQQAVIR